MILSSARLFALASLLCASLTAADAPNSLSPAEQEQGWQLLFEGDSISPWRGYGSAKNDDSDWAKKWTIEDQALKLEGSGGSYFQLVLAYLLGRPSADLIYPLEKFDAFELSIDWKISPGGNSGILYFVADEEHSYPWQTGLEMQVLDNDGHADGEIISHRAGDLYDLQASSVDATKPVGQWNVARIRVANGFIEHRLNDQLLLNVSYGDSEWRKRVAKSKFSSMPDFGRASAGYLVLQDHGDTVWYRNIKIRRLSASDDSPQ